MTIYQISILGFRTWKELIRRWDEACFDHAVPLHLHPIPNIISSKGSRRPSETAIFWLSDRTILANWSLIMIWCKAVMEWVSDVMTKNFRRTWIQHTFSSRLSMVHTGLCGDQFFLKITWFTKKVWLGGILPMALQPVWAMLTFPPRRCENF